LFHRLRKQKTKLKDSFWRRLRGTALFPLVILICLASEGKSDVQGVPECLVYLPPHRIIHAIVVEKASATLSLYRHDEEGLRLVDQFPCSLGKVAGEKVNQGDQRTPSGIFWLEARILKDELPREYGAGALVLNYPNFFNRIDGQKGDGIWIHGTHLPDRTQYPRDTNGCIVVSDETFQKIDSSVDLLESPVIVQEKIHYLSPDQWRQQQTSFLQHLQRWLRTWEEGKYQDPDSLYSKDFRTDPQGAGHLLMVRRALTQHLKKNQVWIRNLSILRNGSTAISTFTQEWWTDQGTSRWVKALYWILEDSNWRILGEEVLERPVIGSTS
jgi:hypothetical protein